MIEQEQFSRMNQAQTDKVWHQWSQLSACAPRRFQRYGELDRDHLEPSDVGAAALEALAKVAWNTALAEALTPVLQAVEIGLRNWMDRAIAQHLIISNHPAPSEWLMHPPNWMHPNDLDVRYQAISKLESQVQKGQRSSFGHHDIVATASFSLWSNMILGDQPWAALSTYRQGHLIRGSDKRKLHKAFDDIRNLRNRAYHLEPVFCQDNLWNVYSQATSYLKILEPRLSKLMESIDRFPEVFGDGNGWNAYQQILYSHYDLGSLEDKTT